MIWQTMQPTYRAQHGWFSGPCFVRSLFTVTSGAIVSASLFWCSVTGISALTGGGDIEELDHA